MPVSNILNYAGILIQAAGGYTLSGGASNVESNWDTPAQLWDGGPGKRYVFWGDTTGDLNIFEFSFTAADASIFTLITNRAYSGSALSIQINMYRDSTTYNVMNLYSCVYNPGLANKRLRALGDRLVLESATNYRILKVNSD